MLVLGRRRGEAVIIETPSGETIRVIVAECRSNSVRLGFECDKSVNIYRDDARERYRTVKSS